MPHHFNERRRLIFSISPIFLDFRRVWAQPFVEVRRLKALRPKQKN